MDGEVLLIVGETFISLLTDNDTWIHFFTLCIAATDYSCSSDIISTGDSMSIIIGGNLV